MGEVAPRSPLQSCSLLSMSAQHVSYSEPVKHERLPLLVIRRGLAFAVRSLDTTERAASSIQLASWFAGTRLELYTRSNGLVSSEPFAHINHASLALAIAPLQLLALCW